MRFFIDLVLRFFSFEAVALQWELVFIAGLLVWAAQASVSPWLRPLRNGFRCFAQKRKLAIATCGLLPVLVRISLLGWMPVPEPSIHDEFSHLLLADTLAHGRLTNPTPPMWRHFESIHIIQRPTYNSMYPPAQGAFLALGEWLVREPWAGVLLSAGLMFAAMCWMMQGWLPASWALFGTLSAILAFGFSRLWINSYMSGAVSGIGGALLMGALPRLKRGKALIRNSVWLGIGVVILMNSRPFEGAVLTTAAVLYLGAGLWRKRSGGWIKIAVPASLIFLGGLAFTGYYNWRVTGSPLKMPYEVNRDTYGWPENLGFLPAKHLTLHDKVLEAMYKKEVAHHQMYASPDQFLAALSVRVFENWTFFLGPVLTIPLLFLPAVFRDRRTRPLVVFIALIAALNLFQMVLYPYHLGPVVPVLFAVVAQGSRHLYVNLARTRIARAFTFACALPVFLTVIAVMKQDAIALGLPLAYWENATEVHRDARAIIQQWLSSQPGKQLVIVHYEPWHSPDQEWVYNGADIDGSKVVWAREVDPESDARLVRYFSDRRTWWLDVDSYPPRVVPYSSSETRCEQLNP